MVNYRVIPPATKRSRMTKDTKIAAAIWAGLCSMERDLIDDVEDMTPKQFLGLFEFHHALELEIAGADHFTNIVPWEKPRHREHTAKRAPVLAKTRHQRKGEETHRIAMLKKASALAEVARSMLEPNPKLRRSLKILSRPFPARQRPMRSKK